MVSAVLEQVGMRLKPLALGAVGCLCYGAAAHAQQIPNPGNTRQIHGSVSVNTTYDSNFGRSSKALSAQRGIEPEEYTARPQVSLDLVQPFGRQVAYLKGSAGYDFHRENDQLDRGRADVQGGYLNTIGPCQGSVYGTYRVAQSDLATLDTPVVKNTQKAYSTAVGAQCGAARGFNGTATVQRAEIMNSALRQRTGDSTTESLSVGAGYSNRRIGTVSLFYNYSSSEFPNRINPGRPVGDGFFTTTYGISAEHHFGTRLNVSASAGLTTLKREFAPAGVDPKFTSTTYSGQGSYRIGNRINVDFIGSRAVTPAQRAGKLYDVVTSGQIQSRYNLGTRFVVSAGYGVSDIDSNVDSASLTAVVTKSRTYSTFASLRYKQNQRTSLTLDVRHDERNANLPDFNYTSTRVGLTAEVGF